MHEPRDAYDTVDFYGLSIDTLDRPGANHIANVESAIDLTETRLALEHFRTTDRILIAGGGLGGQAALVASKFGYDHVTVIEPNPWCVYLLRNEIRVRGHTLNVDEGALSLRDGTAPFYLCPGNWPASGLTKNCEDANVVEVETIDTNRLIREAEITALLLDIEGAEFDIIPYLDLKSLHAVVIEVHGLPEMVAGTLVQSGHKIVHRSGSDNHHVLASIKSGG